MDVPEKDIKKELVKVEKTSLKFEVHSLIKKACKGKRSKTKVLSEISQATGITLAWLTKFSKNPKLYDPGLSKIETLYFYFKGVSISDILKKG